MADRFNISDVMISYSRQDKKFVQSLSDAIRKTGRETWVDWDDIPPTVDWWEEVKAGIEAAHVFVFIISPASVNSEICYKEIEHAVLNNKRIVPVMYKDIVEQADKDKMHRVLTSHNWVNLRKGDDRKQAFRTLLRALEADFEYVHQHTRLLVRANEWQDASLRGSLLLRGDDLRGAELWLQNAYSKDPAPTELQVEYIDASRKRALRFLQFSIVGMLTVILALGLLSIFAVNKQLEAEGLVKTVFAVDENLEFALTELAQAVNQAEHVRMTEQSVRNRVVEAETQQQLAIQDLETAQVNQQNAQSDLESLQESVGNAETQAAVVQELTSIAPTLDSAFTDVASAGQEVQDIQATADAAGTMSANEQATANALVAEALLRLDLVLTEQSQANLGILTAQAIQSTVETQISVLILQVNNANTQQAQAALSASLAQQNANTANAQAVLAQQQGSTQAAIAAQEAANAQAQAANAQVQANAAATQAALASFAQQNANAANTQAAGLQTQVISAYGTIGALIQTLAAP